MKIIVDFWKSIWYNDSGSSKRKVINKKGTGHPYGSCAGKRVE